MASSGNTWFKKLRAKQLRNVQRLNGMRQRFAVDAYHDTSVKKVRGYLAPIDAQFVPRRRGSGCRLSHEKRLLVLERATWRASMRRELFGISA